MLHSRRIVLFLISFHLVVPCKMGRKSDTANHDITRGAGGYAYNCRTGGRKNRQDQFCVPPSADPHGALLALARKGRGKRRSSATGGVATRAPSRGRNGPRETPRGVVRNPLALAMGRFNQSGDDARGPYRISTIPRRQQSAPSRSQRSGACCSTSHCQPMAVAM